MHCDERLACLCMRTEGVLANPHSGGQALPQSCRCGMLPYAHLHWRGLPITLMHIAGGEPRSPASCVQLLIEHVYGLE